jgi:hypothetical protein
MCKITGESNFQCCSCELTMKSIKNIIEVENARDLMSPTNFMGI